MKEVTVFNLRAAIGSHAAIMAAIILWVCMGIPAHSAGQTVGVAFIPYMYGDQRADGSEQMLVTAVGEMKAIDYVFTPQSANDVFETLAKLKRAGKKVGAIVLAGHASEGNPIILFGGGNGLQASDVNLPQLHADLSNAKMSNDQIQIKRFENKIQKLESVADAATPGAQVLVLNCNAAKTEAGKEFIRNLGNVLVGQHGGTVTAPTNLVKIYSIQNYNQWVQHAIFSWFESDFGDTIVDASWLRFQISSKAQGSSQSASHSPDTSKPVPDLGKVWKVTEKSPTTTWNGTWSRIDNSTSFKAEWSVAGKPVGSDEIDFVSIAGNKITLHRKGINGDYTGEMSADGSKITKGTATWYRGKDWSWTAEIQK